MVRELDSRFSSECLGLKEGIGSLLPGSGDSFLKLASLEPFVKLYGGAFDVSALESELPVAQRFVLEREAQIEKEMGKTSSESESGRQSEGELVVRRSGSGERGSDCESEEESSEDESEDEGGEYWNDDEVGGNDSD